jgi:hypothetical protein
MPRHCKAGSYHPRHEPCTGLEAPGLRCLERGPDRPVRDACRAGRAGPRWQLQPGRSARPDLRRAACAERCRWYRGRRKRWCRGASAAGYPDCRRRLVAPGRRAGWRGRRAPRRGARVLTRAEPDRRRAYPGPRGRGDRQFGGTCTIWARPHRVGSVAAAGAARPAAAARAVAEADGCRPDHQYDHADHSAGTRARRTCGHPGGPGRRQRRG